MHSLQHQFITYPSTEEDLQEIFRLMESPEYKHYFEEDEDRFIDRKMNVMMPCTVADTGVVFNAKNTVFDTVSGEPSWDGYEDWEPVARW